MKVRGVNLGNWLVLEKWMGASPLSNARSDDERGLIDELAPSELAKALERHHSTYLGPQDFAWMAEVGVNLVRIPVPYYLFGTAHHLPCVEHLDHAFAWAQANGIQVLVDLHTVPLSQNGFDNGGYRGLCAWSQDPERIGFAVNVLERIAMRYAAHPALWGIEALNEPASRSVLRANLNQVRDLHPDRVARSRAISRKVLVAFYDEVYRRLKPLVGPEVKLVFHDQFDLLSWNRLLPVATYPGVVIDTHLYLNFCEQGMQYRDLPEYQARIARFARQMTIATRHHDVLVGEWSLANHSPLKRTLGADDKRAMYRILSNAQLDVWDLGLGGCYWSYRVDDARRPEWDLRTCAQNGWIDLRHGIFRAAQ